MCRPKFLLIIDLSQPHLITPLTPHTPHPTSSIIKSPFLIKLSSIIKCPSTRLAEHGLYQCLSGGLAFRLLATGILRWRPIATYNPRDRDGWPPWLCHRSTTQGTADVGSREKGCHLCCCFSVRGGLVFRWSLVIRIRRPTNLRNYTSYPPPLNPNSSHPNPFAAQGEILPFCSGFVCCSFWGNHLACRPFKLLSFIVPLFLICNFLAFFYSIIYGVLTTHRLISPSCSIFM